MKSFLRCFILVVFRMENIILDSYILPLLLTYLLQFERNISWNLLKGVTNILFLDSPYTQQKI